MSNSDVFVRATAAFDDLRAALREARYGMAVMRDGMLTPAELAAKLDVQAQS